MKHNIIVSLIPNAKSTLCQIRMRVSFDGNRVDVNTGLSYDSDKWRDGKPKPNTKSQNRQSATEVQLAISKMQDRIDQYFMQCELSDTKPTAEAIRNVARQRSSSSRIGRLSAVFDMFLSQRCRKKNISDSTIQQYKWVCGIMMDYFGDIEVSALDDGKLQCFLEQLTSRIRNSSAETFQKYFFPFVKWIAKQGYADIHRQELGVSLPSVDMEANVYLSPDELRMVENASMKTPKQAYYKDVFLFSCYTGLRFSDIKKLRKSDIYDDVVHTVTLKTGKNIAIELHRKSRDIYTRMMAIYENDLQLFPKLSKRGYSVALINIAKQAGLTRQVTTTYYIGEKRYDITKPLYERITTHVGRRTFVVNCLIHGIPPLVIIKWTGHKDLSALAPYIAILDEQKKAMMQKFDED